MDFSSGAKTSGDWGDRIIEIMELSRPEMVGRMSEAYEYAKGRFDIGVTAKTYLEEYGKVLTCGRRN